MTAFQIIQLSLQSLATIAVAVGLGFTIRQLRLLRASYRDLHDWNRRKAAQDAADKWSAFAEDAVLLEKQFGYKQAHDIVDMKRMDEAFAANSQVKTSLHRILNYLESVANGVRHGVLDEEVVRSAFIPILRKHLNRFAPYIEFRRGQDANVWIEVRDLSARWIADDSKRPLRERLGTE